MSAGEQTGKRLGQRRRLLSAAAGIVLALLACWLTPADKYPLGPLAAGSITLMAAWWIFEVVPIAVTALFPLVLFPLFGIADVRTVGADYGRPVIFLFLGGFLLALGLQNTGAHRRMALHIVRLVGSRPARLVLGIMIASAALSMWISNTAAVMVLLPIGLSLMETTREQGVPDSVRHTLGVSLMLGMAYGADIGGMATLIGTPPNLVFLEMYGQQFPAAPEIGFLQWMVMGLVLSTVFTAIGWFFLTRFIFPMPAQDVFESPNVTQIEIQKLGPIRRDEVIATIVFLVAAVLWMTGPDINIGKDIQIQGWRSLTGLEMASDAAVALAAAILLFILPSSDRPGEALLTWPVARKMPWGILLLLGGGFAIATGFDASGLSELTGDRVSRFHVESPIVMVAVVCTVMTFLTELTSNTAMTNLVLPILARASVALGVDPRILMIPATLSASCAFMLPIATPTQAVVFGSGYVTIPEMIKAGIWFNLLGILLVSTVFLLMGGFVFGIDWELLPAWAE